MEGLTQKSPLGGNFYQLKPCGATAFYIYFEDACKLEKEIGNDLSYIEYLALADASIYITGVSQTEEYIRKTLANISANLDKSQQVEAYTQLASLYYTNFPEKDISQAREFMQKAVEAIDSVPLSQINRQVAADTYYYWAMSEHEYGDGVLADKYIEIAKRRHPNAAYSWWLEKCEKDIVEAKTRRTNRDSNRIQTVVTTPAPLTIPVTTATVDQTTKVTPATALSAPIATVQPTSVSPDSKNVQAKSESPTKK